MGEIPYSIPFLPRHWDLNYPLKGELQLSGPRTLHVLKEGINIYGLMIKGRT